MKVVTHLGVNNAFLKALCSPVFELTNNTIISRLSIQRILFNSGIMVGHWHFTIPLIEVDKRYEALESHFLSVSIWLD